MTDELEKDFGSGSYITRFVSAGPKQYSYQVWSSKQQKEVPGTRKVRGITLNCSNVEQINFSSILRMVHNHDEIDVVQNKRKNYKG